MSSSSVAVEGTTSQSSKRIIRLVVKTASSTGPPSPQPPQPPQPFHHGAAAPAATPNTTAIATTNTATAVVNIEHTQHDNDTPTIMRNKIAHGVVSIAEQLKLPPQPTPFLQEQFTNFMNQILRISSVVVVYHVTTSYMLLIRHTTTLNMFFTSNIIDNVELITEKRSIGSGGAGDDGKSGAGSGGSDNSSNESTEDVVVIVITATIQPYPPSTFPLYLQPRPEKYVSVLVRGNVNTAQGGGNGGSHNTTTASTSLGGGSGDGVAPPPLPPSAAAASTAVAAEAVTGVAPAMTEAAALTTATPTTPSANKSVGVVVVEDGDDRRNNHKHNDGAGGKEVGNKDDEDEEGNGQDQTHNRKTEEPDDDDAVLENELERNDDDDDDDEESKASNEEDSGVSDEGSDDDSDDDSDDGSDDSDDGGEDDDDSDKDDDNDNERSQDDILSLAMKKIRNHTPRSELTEEEREHVRARSRELYQIRKQQQKTKKNNNNNRRSTSKTTTKYAEEESEDDDGNDDEDASSNSDSEDSTNNITTSSKKRRTSYNTDNNKKGLYKRGTKVCRIITATTTATATRNDDDDADDNQSRRQYIFGSIDTLRIGRRCYNIRYHGGIFEDISFDDVRIHEEVANAEKYYHNNPKMKKKTTKKSMVSTASSKASSRVASVDGEESEYEEETTNVYARGTKVCKIITTGATNSSSDQRREYVQGSIVSINEGNRFYHVRYYGGTWDKINFDDPRIHQEVKNAKTNKDVDVDENSSSSSFAHFRRGTKVQKTIFSSGSGEEGDDDNGTRTRILYGSIDHLSVRDKTYFIRYFGREYETLKFDDPRIDKMVSDAEKTLGSKDCPTSWKAQEERNKRKERTTTIKEQRKEKQPSKRRKKRMKSRFINNIFPTLTDEQREQLHGKEIDLKDVEKYILHEEAVADYTLKKIMHQMKILVNDATDIDGGLVFHPEPIRDLSVNFAKLLVEAAAFEETHGADRSSRLIMKQSIQYLEKYQQYYYFHNISDDESSAGDNDSEDESQMEKAASRSDKSNRSTNRKITRLPSDANEAAASQSDKSRCSTKAKGMNLNEAYLTSEQVKQLVGVEIDLDDFYEHLTSSKQGSLSQRYASEISRKIFLLKEAKSLRQRIWPEGVYFRPSTNINMGNIDQIYDECSRFEASLGKIHRQSTEVKLRIVFDRLRVYQRDYYEENFGTASSPDFDDISESSAASGSPELCDSEEIIECQILIIKPQQSPSDGMTMANAIEIDDENSSNDNADDDDAEEECQIVAKQRNGTTLTLTTRRRKRDGAIWV